MTTVKKSFFAILLTVTLIGIIALWAALILLRLLVFDRISIPGMYQVPESGEIAMRIPTELIPKCPDDGSAVTMNLRSDDTFVQDDGWYEAAERYRSFIDEHHIADDGRILLLELGVGANTPGIIKYPFWRITATNPNTDYICINYGDALVPNEIESKSICINADIGDFLNTLNI